jgi:hypothetical protein
MINFIKKKYNNGRKQLVVFEILYVELLLTEATFIACWHSVKIVRVRMCAQPIYEDLFQE